MLPLSTIFELQDEIQHKYFSEEVLVAELALLKYEVRRRRREEAGSGEEWERN